MHIQERSCKFNVQRGKYFTNYSLRATGTTALFDAGIPECIIQKRTGHKSLDSLRTYQRVTLSQEHAVAQILSPTTATDVPATPTASKATMHTDEVFIDNLPLELFELQ